MRGSVYRRNCTCKKTKCTCGSKWVYKVDVGINPITGRRKQVTKGGFSTKQEAQAALSVLLNNLQQGTYQA